MEILCKGTVCVKANRPKLCGNCAYPQNFHTRKLGEIAVFYPMHESPAEAYSESSQSFKIELFVKIVNDFNVLNDP